MAGSPHVLQFKRKQSACIQQDVQLNVVYSMIKSRLRCPRGPLNRSELICESTAVIQSNQFKYSIPDLRTVCSLSLLTRHH